MTRIITYDEPKRQANIDKHGLDFDLLTGEFFTSAMILDAKDGRLMAIGPLEDGTVACVFVLLGSEGLSVISLRPASTKERQRYDSWI